MNNKGKASFSYLLSLTLVVSISLGLVGLQGIARADQASSSATVTNSLPVASSVTISGGETITLTENATTTATVTFTVTDNNTCSDIGASTTAVLHTTASGSACSPDNANCYSMTCGAIANCTGGADTIGDFTCTAPLEFYADPAVWTVTVTPKDNAGAGATSTDTATVAALTALDVTSSIAYGALALGADTATADQTTTVTNTGNGQIDVQVDGYGASDGDGYSMACTVGNITIGNEKFHLSASTAYASKIALTDTAATQAAFDLAKGAASTKAVYWGFGMPASGVSGSCTGYVNFTAVSG
ncbi:hypothetical protein KKH05_00805 [Patescibacteria group bacterium]|nr:hypothetical protein [Patescibacteria group bacterium]